MKPLKFTKYNSLENNYNAKFIQMITDQGLSGGEWIACEKVHGSNFSFWYNGTDIRTAKRSGFDDQFGTAPALIEQYKQDIEDVYKEMQECDVITDGDLVVFYGEAFGGSYHGKKGVHAKCMQKGMDYHPETEFVLFDIGVAKDIKGTETKFWLSYEDMLEFTKHTELMTSPEVGVGTLEEMLKLNNEFPTLIPEQFGLELPEGVTEHTIGEGFVIRPLNGEKFLRNGSRVIIKSRNSKFAEKGKGDKKTPKDFTMPEEVVKVYQEFGVYLTHNRLESVISKECAADDLTWKMLGKFSGLLMQDAVEAYNKDYELNEDTELKAVVGDHWKNFTRHAMNVCQELCREHFKKTIFVS